MTQTSTQPDGPRAHLVERLRESRARYLGVIRDIPAEATAVRRTDSWSILEVAEHVAVAERQMLALWTKLAQAGEGERAKDAVIPVVAANRANKQVALERSRPSGRYQALAEAVRDFSASREQTIAYVESHSEELRGKTVEHPLAGKLDGYQLFLLMAGHAERHAAQIAELKQGFQEKH